ncbi:uncharacterized protein LOC110854585 [Folsomia candida]|uniref:BTB domain-containing protein n=1 Tax=Folsomia candida TaxID=158441 RepID=A0A226DVW0_FOLCA|nr:uncharacterized protein LOC110854585 [Folsomia candida]OXA49615.1 hypothetical protein Fcan01_16069 [Folsomia candida]
MAYGGCELASRVLHHYKKIFDLETSLENADSYSLQELFNLSHKGRGTDFVFIFNGEFNNKNMWIYVKESVVAAGSEVLAKIMKTRRAQDISGRAVENYYAMLDESTGYRDLDMVQFKRMIEYLYTGKVESLPDDASYEELCKLSTMTSLFLVRPLVACCQKKSMMMRRGLVRPEVEAMNEKNPGNSGEIVRAPESGKALGWKAKLKQEILAQVKQEVVEQLRDEMLAEIRAEF